MLDNATCHSSKDVLTSDDGLISVFFLPPNVTSLIQPMDQNVLNLLKLYYRKNLLSGILSENDNDIVQSLKSITLKDVILNLASAWAKFEASSISKIWNNLFKLENLDEEDEVPLSILASIIRNEEYGKSLEETTELLLQVGNKIFHERYFS